jgi:hypothetical protein
MTKPHRISSAPSALLVLGVLLLTGCTQAGYLVLDRERTAQDELPADFERVDLDGYDLSTSRYSGSYQDTDFYVLLPEGKLAPCLALSGAGGPVIVCGGDGAVETRLPDGTRVQFGPEPAVGGRGWAAISDNIRVRD